MNTPSKALVGRTNSTWTHTWTHTCTHPTPPHLEDHLCAGHSFHHYLGVAGRGLAQHLGADGGHIQQDGLERMSVQEELEDTGQG